MAEISSSNPSWIWTGVSPDSTSVTATGYTLLSSWPVEAPPSALHAADVAFRRLWRAFLLLACQFVVVAVAAVWGWAR